VILVVEDGRIVERGRHDELLARGGRYAQLYHEQFAEAGAVPAPAAAAWVEGTVPA
jgi:ATP-binding cassette, subfamily B, bacterial